MVVPICDDECPPTRPLPDNDESSCTDWDKETNSTCETDTDNSSALSDKDIYLDSDKNAHDSLPKLTSNCCGSAALLATFVLVWFLGGVCAFFFAQYPPDPIASCGDCHCSVAEGSQCPSWIPETNYPIETVAVLASQVPSNPHTLNCNPYDDDNCEVEPKQQYKELGEAAVCAIHYDETEPRLADPRGATYTLVSYPSRGKAETAGGFITHAGACGVCSSTQDLAAYLQSTDLTSEGISCSKRGMLNFGWGVKCYESLGFTNSCAKMWTYNGYNTRDKCMLTCLANLLSENNGDSPKCALNDCLQCDEDQSGPIFKKFAARTRRRSGLLSAIVRPCESLHQISHSTYPWQITYEV